jgi:hypothetical protein
VRDGMEIASAQLMRFYSLETWLRHVSQWALIDNLPPKAAYPSCSTSSNRGVAPQRSTSLS